MKCSKWLKHTVCIECVQKKRDVNEHKETNTLAHTHFIKLYTQHIHTSAQCKTMLLTLYNILYI